MHEVGIIQDVIEMAIKQAQASGATRLHELSLRVGSLSGAVPEALNFAFDLARRQTLAEGARLQIESVPAAWWCGTCQNEFESECCSSECPRCHQFSSELRRGRELELVSIEIS
jgi:hydrogenase nickel incorporation protein HypA/HybF